MCCILFHFYIKPQPLVFVEKVQLVVSYSISTSNHNTRIVVYLSVMLYLIPFLHQTTTFLFLPLTNYPLYLIPFLHQTTTVPSVLKVKNELYLIPFLHQTTTIHSLQCASIRCILFHFYIKPQLSRRKKYYLSVVSYSISTSNHNFQSQMLSAQTVVSYSISTSNHNLQIIGLIINLLYLIPFLHQTTTFNLFPFIVSLLYLIPFLHQTTTRLCRL